LRERKLPLEESLLSKTDEYWLELKKPGGGVDVLSTVKLVYQDVLEERGLLSRQRPLRTNSSTNVQVSVNSMNLFWGR
jgi:hypothetical protein